MLTVWLTKRSLRKKALNDLVKSEVMRDYYLFQKEAAGDTKEAGKLGMKADELDQAIKVNSGFIEWIDN